MTTSSARAASRGRSAPITSTGTAPGSARDGAIRQPVLRHLWLLMLVAAPLLAGLYLLLPASGSARTITYPIFGIIATVAIVVGVRINRPDRRGAWQLIAFGLALLSVGDITYTVIALTSPEVPYPSLADGVYFAAYGALVVGVLRLVRGRMTGGDRIPMIDGAILAAGAGSVFWIVTIRPAIAGSVDIAAAIVSLSYPCIDLILLGLAFRVLLSSNRNHRSMQFLLFGLLTYFAADTIYAVAVLDGSYVDGHPVDALWILGILVLSVAALHPSSGTKVVEVETESRLSRSRLALLGVASMMAPAILVVREGSAGADEAVGLILTWTLLFGLVLIRLASTVDALGVSLLQRRRLQDDLTYQAHHDPLTRLANRTLFEERLRSAIDTAPETTGLVFLDLDDFKTINDTLGHASGDELLRIVAERIKRELRDGDLAARLGGDEFAILVGGCSEEAIAKVVAERVLAGLRAPVHLEGRPFQVRGSAGVAIGHAGSTPLDLMRAADVAMYQAKANGKDKAESYEARMHSQVVQSYQLRTELAEAIETGQFVLHYLPAIALATGEIVGAEALVRWRHPERGLLGPADFIPHAESSGLINDLGLWILREACRTAARWPLLASGSRPMVSVNLSASQLLQPGIVDDVATILAETGLPANHLFLEVTESALVDLEPAARALGRLRELGVLLALDDFGTGYSALSYLAKLPFDVVKIDRVFIGSLGEDRRVEALLSGIIVLCRNLELSIVAEGVETEAQLDAVTRLGFDAAQGFLFARPIPDEAFVALVLAAQPRPDGRSSVRAAVRAVGAPHATATSREVGAPA
ncbi:MAG: EAL domain-containing protein [Chloroflexota bacterium]|nr:EAL domain-containing protein [Chloroflexota bacterium]